MHVKYLSPLNMNGNTQHSLSFVFTVQSAKLNRLKIKFTITMITRVEFKIFFKVFLSF